MVRKEYRVVLRQEALDFFVDPKVDARIKRIIRRKIGLLAGNPHLGKPLLGEFTGYRRLAVSYYRVIYHIEESRLVVDVIRIGLRRDIYD